MLAVFTADFEILPGTIADSAAGDQAPYEVGPVELGGE
jgi:hypothetical protein